MNQSRPMTSCVGGCGALIDDGNCCIGCADMMDHEGFGEPVEDMDGQLRLFEFCW